MPTRPIKRLFPIILLLLLCPSPGFTDTTSPETLTASSHRELKRFFASLDYNRESITEGVPPIVLESLPADLPRIRQSVDKKDIFFLSLLPLVLLANDEISRERQELEEILTAYDHGETVPQEDRSWIARLASRYRIEQDPLVDRVARQGLLHRLDIIPPSLVLAQAANESGYGTSRFALLGNNIFGEWTFIAGEGMIPAGRPASETYEVRRFPSLYASVQSYMKNLNTNQAYRAFREQRARLRNTGRPLRGIDLADGVEPYSIRGKDYVRDIRAIIRHNRLHLLSTATLRGVPLSASERAGDAGLLSMRRLPPPQEIP